MNFTFTKYFDITLTTPSFLSEKKSKWDGIIMILTLSKGKCSVSVQVFSSESS